MTSATAVIKGLVQLGKQAQALRLLQTLPSLGQEPHTGCQAQPPCRLPVCQGNLMHNSPAGGIAVCVSPCLACLLTTSEGSPPNLGEDHLCLSLQA